jgi:hypothetical protein
MMCVVVLVSVWVSLPVCGLLNCTPSLIDFYTTVIFSTITLYSMYVSTVDEDVFSGRSGLCAGFSMKNESMVKNPLTITHVPDK